LVPCSLCGTEPSPGKTGCRLSHTAIAGSRLGTKVRRFRRIFGLGCFFLLTFIPVALILLLVSDKRDNHFEGELWIPQDSFLAPLSYQSQPSSFLRRVFKGVLKIEVVFSLPFPYNSIGLVLNGMIAMHRSKHTYLIQSACCLLLILLVCGCVGKKPDDEVALIKSTLGKFERGVNQASPTILDSILMDRRPGLSSQLLDSLSQKKKLTAGRIAEKSFVIVKDSAEVRLRLSLEYSAGAGEKETAEKPVLLFLRKKKGQWRISSFGMSPDGKKPEETD
jgi:hypothetical protein